MNGRTALARMAALVVLAWLGPLAAGSPQDTGQASLDVPARVLALLESRCSRCHAPDSEEPKASRAWDSADDLALTRELLVVPDSPDLSDLWLVIDEDEMPPPDSDVEPLTGEERALLHDWIAGGAPLGELSGDAPGNAPHAQDETDPHNETDETDETGETEGVPSASAQDHHEGPSTEGGVNVRRWLGRLHPSVVHFPIALLLAAALAEVLVLLGARGLQPTVRFCVIVGFSGAVLAATLGWLAGETASVTKEPQLTWHRWLAVSTAVLALLLLLASEARVRHGDPSPWTARTRWLLLLTAVMVSVTGHLGGILTHGVDYLSLPW